ncbi:hypothetical protein POSPLADRAFT_1045766 [Postia placenta MAD-698-R-SB12]|uniref:RING-type domain-containing protein n=1 Tax=Postia placenta MAD-698-R-SB12 TaxID=670580 RepID=A0A1X6N4R4_9APHY|nr:hypothetical protein POSPLADRAFT_1045766 [Postia placenta MAD-698-R-SB12]OSX63442.1 hypothetical protein POSPLADRAFT_1045766 [Postia placenta MAD-698-R-SB12]
MQHSAKKPKVDEFKRPLSIVNGNTGVSTALPTKNSTIVGDVRSQLEEVQVQISNLERLHGNLSRKRNRTNSDVTRMATFASELSNLQVLKEEYTAAIPSATLASVTSTQTESKPFVVGRPVSHPIASGSNVQLPPPFVIADMNPIILNTFTQPVASGSSNQLPPSYSARSFGSSIVTPYAFAEEERLDSAGTYPNEPLYFDFEVSKALPNFNEDDRYDEDGNFYGRGRDNFAGPVAKADDIDKFLVSAGNAEQFDGNANVDQALEKLGLDGQYKPLPGMQVALMPHQTIGVAWMLDKEKSSDKGGCMSDEMGLGKTVQMIAVMVSNSSQDPLCKTNLIVAPVALLDQWQLEIEMKTDCNLKCLIYHGSNKPKNKRDLMQYDIVLTTYQTLALEWPDDEAEEREAKRKAKKKRTSDNFIESVSEDEKSKKKKKQEPVGLLFQVEWYRVVLDEAQNIRNKRTRGSRAVTKLESNYRWCLTGTPIINGLSDAYGLLRFLRIRPWYDWNDFNGHISRFERKQPVLATSRLQAIFATMLLRRKKDSMLDGKRLIELPLKEVILTKLTFTLEERDIYKMVELKSQAIFNRFLKAGTVLKFLVLLLRLRQVCSHPCLIQEHNAAFIAAADLNDGNHDKRYELSRARQLVSDEFVESIQTKMKNIALQRIEAEKESPDATIDDEECPICYDTFTDPIVTPCAHIFCRECINNVFNTEPVENGGEQARYKFDERPCPACRGVLVKHKLFSRSAFEPSDKDLGTADGADGSIEGGASAVLVDDFAEVEHPKPGSTFRKRKLQKKSAYDSDEEEEGDDDLSDFVVEDDEDEEEKDACLALRKRLGKRRAIILSDDEMDIDDDVICGAKPDVEIPPEQVKLMPRFLPSTKMKHMMEFLKAWAESNPDEKTLVISQWTQCLQLVSDYLTENGFLHVKYQGDMNRRKRDQAIRVFMAKDKATIMLMSLKCGGVGLNLTRANRVISLDLGWSEAVESQAFDRVHRLGQTRPVYVHRLVIADTVEDRVLALQERKKNLADGSLGEGNGKKLGRLSVRELANCMSMISTFMSLC